MLFLRWRVGKYIPAFLFVLVTTLLVACGSSTTTGNTAAPTNTPTKTVCPTTTAVIIKSVSATQLQGTTQTGKDVQATFTNSTRFTQPATLKPTDIQTGSTVAVTVKQNADSTYTALTISQGGFSGGRQGGFPRGGSANGCSGQRRGGGFGGGSGTPTAGGSGTQSRQLVSGTVNQISNTSMTLTDASGNDYTIAITSTTRINSQKTITANDLKAGQIVSILGTSDSSGTIAASSVSVLSGFPRRNAAPTPTVSVK